MSSRRIKWWAMMACSAVVLMSVAMVIANLFWTFRIAYAFPNRHHSLSFEWGTVSYQYNDRVYPPAKTGWSLLCDSLEDQVMPGAPYALWPWAYSGAANTSKFVSPFVPRWEVILPLWMIGLPAAIGAYCLYCSERRPKGHCVCGYSRIGIARTAPCPECGIGAAIGVNHGLLKSLTAWVTSRHFKRRMMLTCAAIALVSGEMMIFSRVVDVGVTLYAKNAETTIEFDQGFVVYAAYVRRSNLDGKNGTMELNPMHLQRGWGNWTDDRWPFFVHRWESIAVGMPLWIVTLSFLVLCGALFQHLRHRKGHCACGCDLAEIPPGSRCPECGEAPKLA